MQVGKLRTGPRIQATTVLYRSQIYILGGNDAKEVTYPRQEL